MRKKVYDIRLNPADYALLGDRDDQLAMDAWKSACQSTQATILASYGKELRDAAMSLRPTLPAVRADACCARCGGSGYRDDREDWIVLNDGKKCFKCWGSGIEPKMEPWWFRRRVVDSLRNATPAQAAMWARKTLAAKKHAYRGVLLDIAQTILGGQYPSALPH